MERLEHQSSKDRARASDLEREVKRLKAKVDTQHRVYTVTKGEADLLKDKFKALEKRLNRTLLEKDLPRRAIKNLEKKSGQSAARTQLTADEIAASDRTVAERIAAEAAEAARAQEKLAVEPAKAVEEAPAAEAPRLPTRTSRRPARRGRLLPPGSPARRSSPVPEKWSSSAMGSCPTGRRSSRRRGSFHRDAP